MNNNSDIAIIFSEGSTTTLAYHGNNPHAPQVLSRTALGVEDFSLNASSIFPNPSNGNFTVKAKTALSEINVYTQTGAFVKTVKGGEEGAEVNVSGLSTGVYLLELKNETDKAWKKMIVK